MADSNSFTSHFVELRTRLLQSLIFIFIVFIFAYIFAEETNDCIADISKLKKSVFRMTGSTSTKLDFTFPKRIKSKFILFNIFVAAGDTKCV